LCSKSFVPFNTFEKDLFLENPNLMKEMRKTAPMEGLYKSAEKRVEIYQYPVFLIRFIMTDVTPFECGHLLSI